MQAIGRQPRRAPDGAPVHYKRHRPEQATLYRLVQQHAATFFAEAEEAADAELPQFVKDEFDAFLECGILAHGFLRLRCGDCGHDKLVALSCKRRGFCPSCGARRMAQTAAHLVDHVIPHVPVRQWVLSLPIPLRLLLAARPKLVTPVLQVVHRVITRYLLGPAELKAGEADSGAVTLIQRFGSAANIHLHCLVLDGVYRRGGDGELLFVEVAAPSDEALQAVLHKVITRLMKLLTRRGVLIEEQGQTYSAGQKVLTLQGAMPRQTDFNQTLCADIDGFSLHAAVRCGAAATPRRRTRKSVPYSIGSSSAWSSGCKPQRSIAASRTKDSPSSICRSACTTAEHKRSTRRRVVSSSISSSMRSSTSMGIQPSSPHRAGPSRSAHRSWITPCHCGRVRPSRSWAWSSSSAAVSTALMRPLAINASATIRAAASALLQG
ncbi:MAG: transposase zinc-binding domain-containing protein [Rubrivivax sp.]